MTKDGYPTAREISKLRDLAGRQNDTKSITKDPRPTLEFLRSIWWTPDWGFTLTGKHKLKLKLSTGGWSGNEEIISALKDTWFWKLNWYNSRSGGHYILKIDLKRYLPSK